MRIHPMDPYFDDPNCPSGIINIDTGVCIPVGIDINNLPECSTGVYDDQFVCQPVGTSGEPETFIVCIDTFENDEISGCFPAEESPLPRQDVPEATVDTPAPPPAQDAVATVALPMQLPETGPGDVAMISGSLGLLFVLAGVALRRIAAGGH